MLLTYHVIWTQPATGMLQSNPVAVEVYSDSVEYYKDVDRLSKVPATTYTENIIK